MKNKPFTEYEDEFLRQHHDSKGLEWVTMNIGTGRVKTSLSGRIKVLKNTNRWYPSDFEEPFDFGEAI